MRFSGLGQYVPVDSPVHRLEPRAKVGIVAAFTVALFAVDGFIGLAVMGATVAAAVALSRVPARVALRGVRAASIILAFTLSLNALRWQPATASLLRVGPVAVDADGLTRGLFFAVRIVLLVVGTSLVTLTTTPVDLTDALERLMRPLHAFRIRTAEFAMMIAIALRFIPTTIEEAERVIAAQTARGAVLDRGGPVRRVRAFVPVLVPLFVGLFRRADELAVAMEARGWRGGEGRTRLREARMRAPDWLALVGGAAAFSAVAVFL